MVIELDNEDVDELEIDHVSLDNFADHIVVSELQLMTSKDGAPKLWASVSSRVHICATEFRQQITTCMCANYSAIQMPENSFVNTLR